MTRTRLALACVVAAALLLCSCGDDDSVFSPTTGAPGTTGTGATGTTTGPTTTVAPTTSTAATTTTAETTTTTVATTTTTSTPAGCTGAGAGPIPPDAVDSMGGSVMFDGDDLVDTFTAFHQGGAWQLYTQLGTGFSARLVLDDAWAATHWPMGVNNLRPIATLTLGSPEQVMLVQIYGGTVAAYALFAFEDCQIVPLTGDDGLLPDLWVGMGPTHSDWPACGPGPTVSQVVYSSPEGCGDISTCGTPNVTKTEYQVQRHPARLVWVSEETWVSNPPEREYLRSLSCVP